MCTIAPPQPRGLDPHFRQWVRVIWAPCAVESSSVSLGHAHTAAPWRADVSARPDSVCAHLALVICEWEARARDGVCGSPSWSAVCDASGSWKPPKKYKDHKWCRIKSKKYSRGNYWLPIQLGGHKSPVMHTGLVAWSSTLDKAS